MDANGLRFWMLSSRDDWKTSIGSGGLFYCTDSNRLQLRSLRQGSPPVEDFAAASKMVETTPMTRDQFGNYARWDLGSGHVVAGGSGPGEIPIYTPPGAPTDLVQGYDGILYVAVDGTLVMIDQRARWPNFTLADKNFQFWRLAALPGGGVLALDRTNSQLGKVIGQPLPQGPALPVAPGVLRSCEENPNPPHLAATYPLPAETFVAIAAMVQGRFALLSWQANAASNTRAFLRLFDETNRLGPAVELGEVKFPYALAWLEGQQFAVLVTGLKEAMIYDLQDSGASLAPAGETYLLAALNAGPFVHSFGAPPYYAKGTDILPLLPLSLNSFAGAGDTDPANPGIFDSGSSRTIWHRLFLETIVPPGCGIVVWLAAANAPADLKAGGSAPWFPHVLGAIDTSSLPVETPRAVWQSVPSEVAFAKPLLSNAPVKDRQGLFMALVQRAGKVVRSLRGRYLGVRVHLSGDQRSTPEIAALRVYASRFSYVDHYLPEIYREDTFGPGADQDGPSTRYDFFERFVDLFEAQMTRIEDRTAGAYLLIRPESTPDDSLDWLGGWIGLDPSGYPPHRRRARLLDAPDLYRQRGTLGGITRALDIATNGMASRGAIILVEDFRLRHTFATILGADLSISDNPLLPGYSGSSNSFVGDTLFLGDPFNKEFLALFAADIRTAAEQQQVSRLYDQLAHRLTVFIHDAVEPVDFNLVARVVEQEKPAHVMATLRRASQAFMIGLASLAGVNTYLAPDPPRGSATVDVSRIGRYDVITHLPSLDPRLDDGVTTSGYPAPVARVSGPPYATPGQAVQLDGSASTAPPGATLESYIWKWMQK